MCDTMLSVDDVVHKVVLGFVAAAGLAVSLYSYDRIRKRVGKYMKAQGLYQEYKEMLLPDMHATEALVEDILRQMHVGMERANSSTVLMLPTYVVKLPNGHETGSCYAIDIGGTNFRVVHYLLSDKPGVLEKQVMRQVSIPEEVYTGSSKQFFDFLATQLADFIQEQESGQDGSSGADMPSPRSDSSKLPVVGFCFSFPVEQTALSSGKLISWTKGFDVEGVVGRDVVQLLSDALLRAGQPCRVTALVNDTVGVLAASCYYDAATEMGVILGTGTNACIVDKVSKMPKWKPKGVFGDTRTAINTEWGCYSSSLLPRCKEDLELDAASGPQQGRMLMEKLMSGKYLGEITSRILLTFARRGELFGGDVPVRLAGKPGLSTADVAEIESDSSALRSRVAYVLRNSLGVQPVALNLETLYMVQAICRLVVRRSARMAAALLVAVLRLQDWLEAPRRLVVAVDGGVYLKYANWRHFLEDYLREAFGARAKELMPLLQFKPVADGSSFGAAVLAAAAASH